MDIIQEYFLGPILSNGWFNPVNSITYGIILVIAVYLVFKLLVKMKVRIDRHFLYAVVPFIIWASSTRVLHDAAFAGVLEGSVGEFYSLPIFPTPGSYLLTFMLALIVLLFSLSFQKFLGESKATSSAKEAMHTEERWRLPYWKTMLAIGAALDAVNFALLPITDLLPVLIILGITALWACIFLLSGKFLSGLGRARAWAKEASGVFNTENSGLLTAHMLDASATYTAMTFFGYLEQHPLPRFLIQLSGPAAMFPLKLAVMVPVLYLIDKYTEPGEFRTFLKIVILILGLAPGLRDMIRLMAGV